MQLSRKKAGIPALIGCGIAAGLINGLLGAGGGIVLVFAISYFCRGTLQDTRDVYANALLVTLMLTLTSTALYILRGNVPGADLSTLVLPAALGGLVGGILLGRISSGALKTLFAVLLVISGIIMILR